MTARNCITERETLATGTMTTARAFFFLPNVYRPGFFTLDPPELILVDPDKHGFSTLGQLCRNFFSGDIAAHRRLDNDFQLGSRLFRCGFNLPDGLRFSMKTMTRQRGETEYGEINDNSISVLCFASIAKMIMIY